MDRVKDESPPMEKRTISFLNENGDIEKALDTDDQSDLQSVDWNRHPPVADVKIDNRYLKPNKLSDRTKTCCHAVSVITVTIVIILFWILMTLPHLCYFQVGICTQDSSLSSSSNTVTNNSNLTCSNHTYTGICQQFFNSCSTNTLIHQNTSTVTETNLITLFTVLSDDQLLGDACYNAVDDIKRFLCQYSYQPCDDESQVLVPSRRECENLRDVACSLEWQFLLQQSYGYLLPDCSSLPETAITPHCNENTNTVIPSSTTSTSIMTTPTPSSIPIVSSGSGSPPPSQPPNQNECLYTYTGTICAQTLSICTQNGNTISTNNAFDGSYDSTLDTLKALLPFQAGPTCLASQDEVFRLLCRVRYEPCDSNSIVHLPTQSECLNIRDNVCRTEWTTLENIAQFANLLPNCSELPLVAPTLSCVSPSVAPTPQATPTPSLSPSPSPSSLTFNTSFQCNEREGFYLYTTTDTNSTINNTCQARCDSWIIFESQTAADLRDYSVLTVILIGLLVAFAVIFFSVVRYKRMFAFPSMFIVYQNITLMVLGVTILVQFIDRFGLSCPADNLVISSLSSATPFCKIGGFLYIYCVLSTCFWWISHVGSTFWKVMFPFHARAHDKKTKYIHIILLISGIILPAITPLAAELDGSYFVHRYPPILCVPSNTKIFYYGGVLPYSLTLCVGITLLIVILHVLHQKQRLFKHRTTLSYFLGLSPAEKKLLIIFFYYVLLGSLTVTSIAVSTGLLSSTTEIITNKFQCEARPYDSDFECSVDYNNLISSDSLTVVTYIVIGIFPFFNLLFALNINEVKSRLKSCFNLDGSDKFRSRTASTSAAIEGPDTPFTLRRKISYAINNPSTSSVVPLSSNGVPGGTVGRSGIYRQRTTTV